MRRVLDRFSRRIDIVVRHCSESDLEPLEWLGSFTSHRLFMREQFERHRRGENVMLVAAHADFPVGQIWIDLTKRASEGSAVVWALRVIASLQGLGIGLRLMLAGESVAAAAGLEAAEIGVEHDNDDVRSWYERLGYRYERREVTEQSYASPDGGTSSCVFDQLILRKSLRASETDPRIELGPVALPVFPDVLGRRAVIEIPTEVARVEAAEVRAATAEVRKMWRKR